MYFVLMNVDKNYIFIKFGGFIGNLTEILVNCEL